MGGGLTRHQFLEGGCWERGGDFFQGGGGGVSYSFYIKNKVKSVKFVNKNVFFCHKEEFKLGIFSKNLVAFRRWDEFQDGKFLITL